MYEFNSEGRRTRMFWIRGGRSSMPERPRAAFAMNENQVYILGSTKVWQIDLSTRRVIADSEKLITEQFPGLTEECDSAMLYDNATVYFFRKKMYYPFDMQQNTLVGPYDAASKFIKDQCIL